MPPPLIDTHVHLDLLDQGQSLPQEVTLARAVGVVAFVLPGVRPTGWPRLLETACSVEGAALFPGVHPLAAEKWNDRVAEELERLLDHPRSLGVGEIGLDGMLDVPMEVQERAFRSQLELAVNKGLPVSLHCRKSYRRLLDLLEQGGVGKVGGILHGFSGSLEIAEEAVGLGLAIGVGGVVTWPGARRLPETIRCLPEASIVLETDAPDLPPHPHRGEACRPAWLELIAARVAELRSWSYEKTAEVTTANARRLLHLERLG